MSEQRAIARELVRASHSGESVVLASVVRTVGATYRGVGARMIVRADNTTVGLLSGGCLEGELVERAVRVRESGAPEVVSYDGRSGDELIWGLGLGCNGLVEILLEPRGAASAGALGALLDSALDDAAPSVLATVVRATGEGAPEIGARVLVRAPVHVSRDGDWGRGAALGAVIADAQSGQVRARRGMNLEYVLSRDIEGSLDAAVTVEVAFELVMPSIDIVICGSGPDVVPVARLATSLGWGVTVVDPRPVAFTPPERFGSARVVECAHSDCLGEVVSPNRRTVAVVMSHNYERDLDYLDGLARSDAAYIGVLGPRARTERLLRDLDARGRPFPEGMLDRLFAPIGLDLGGDGAEAIALSIVAEIAAVMSGRAASHLSGRAESIHEMPALG
jgi:xanthine dehydrogenase accessory factor